MPRIALLLLVGCLVVASGVRSADPVRKVDFARDVRPILADNCVQCHGPDEKARKADMRLDTKDSLALAKKELPTRVTSKDADEVMPPPKSSKKLTAQQIATLKAWMEEGGTWSSHWAFTAPVRPVVPQTKHATANPIDDFIFARLEE